MEYERGLLRRLAWTICMSFGMSLVLCAPTGQQAAARKHRVFTRALPQFGVTMMDMRMGQPPMKIGELAYPTATEAGPSEGRLLIHGKRYALHHVSILCTLTADPGKDQQVRSLRMMFSFKKVNRRDPVLVKEISTGPAFAPGDLRVSSGTTATGAFVEFRSAAGGPLAIGKVPVEMSVAVPRRTRDRHLHIVADVLDAEDRPVKVGDALTHVFFVPPRRLHGQ